MTRKHNTDTPGPLTLILKAHTPDALSRAFQMMYPELHNVAAAHHRWEAAANTLRTTEILHESFLRMMRSKCKFENRSHFFSAASASMRRVLVDRARRRHANKRPSHRARADFREAERLGFEEPKELLDLDVALTRLEEVQPRWRKIAELRIFGGFSTREAAAMLGIGSSTGRRHWAFAKQWLRQTLQS